MNRTRDSEAAQAMASIRLDGNVARLAGRWTVEGLEGIERSAGAETQGPEVVVDVSGITAMDTSGALLLVDLLERWGLDPGMLALDTDQAELVAMVLARRDEMAAPGSGARTEGWLAGVGRASWAHVEQGVAFLSFLGQTSVALARALVAPRRIRWRAILANMESAGVNALPIVGLLSFLLGVVVAYQGGLQLRTYGANIFIVELVSLTLLRELAPLITAIIVAGRTGASYTAQIGTMTVTEEVDALRTIGIDPVDLLVLPKLIALVLALPLVCMFADILGLLGGMVVATLLLDVSFSEFMDRLPQVVSLASFLIGIGKAPLFAAVIALVGCFQGFQVRGGADSVGRQTTVSVVQAIFLVIVLDAALVVIIGGWGL